jgi:CAAX prenyl protease-like protein
LSPMHVLREKFQNSAAYARVAPFVIFVAPLAIQGQLGEASLYWIYLLRTLAGAWLIWEMRPFVPELRWVFSWEAVVAGIVLFVMWVAIDPYYTPSKPSGPDWNPTAFFGAGSAVSLTFMVARVAGMSLVVPPLEEVFWRSFLYRWFVRTDFQNMPLNRFHPTSFIVTSALFGVEHGNRWLAGILFGFGMQWLVLRKNRIGDAITAHAITNFLLGVYVWRTGAWQFF